MLLLFTSFNSATSSEQLLAAFDSRYRKYTLICSHAALYIFKMLASLMINAYFNISLRFIFSNIYIYIYLIYLFIFIIYIYYLYLLLLQYILEVALRFIFSP